jgi:CDP-glucose 4,6-dehydratase
VPGTIRSLLDGKQPIIRSDGTLKRDYFYIQDGVLAYVMLAEKLLAGELRGEAFNFSNEQPITVLEIAELISKLMEREDLKPLIKNQATNEIPHQYLSAERARQTLGWSARYSLEKGLRETISWYRSWLTDLDQK